jgi:cytochrome c oxidase assembly factor 3
MSQYIDKKTVEASYRPNSGVSIQAFPPFRLRLRDYIQIMSPGLKRAREPFRVRNALTGLALGAFAVGIWAYSISAVKQDVFDDVDAEVMEQKQQQQLQQQQQRLEVLNVKEEQKVMEAAVNAPAPSSGSAAFSSPGATVTPSAPVAPVRGVLQWLDSRYPWLLDPQRKTLIWGAPPVDNIGKMGMVAFVGRRI